MRKENDSIGEMELEDQTLFGLQTARALENFNIRYHQVNRSLIYAIVLIKKAAAITYQKIGIGKEEVNTSIMNACDKILDGKADEFFRVSALQGGAGTSTNMNVNEVIANIALIDLGFQCGEYSFLHPLDDVNKGQSTNDVYPTALRIAAINQIRTLSDVCANLQTSLQQKENEYETIEKLGRTELMDAVPITLGQEFGAFAQAISRDRWRIYKLEERLRQVNIGGTAVGLGNNAERKYRFGILEELRALTGIGLAVAEYPMDITQNNDVFVEVSGILKALAVNLMKISNDLRLMNSGPFGGFGEISLYPVQMGSTIMPGKVNPVIPEMMIQIAMKVISNDFLITTAAAHGEFELNAFLPIIADALLESLEILTDGIRLFQNKCIEKMEPNEKRCKELLEASYAFSTLYTQKYGYDKVSEIIKNSDGNYKKAKNILEGNDDFEL